MNDWRKVLLKDITLYSEDRVNVSQLNLYNYISTENMNSNREGVNVATSLPSSKTVSRYYEGDILISNIRPYFKKIWFADKDGGCSNDVLVFRNKDHNQVDNKFLYYNLFTDHFFDYVMSGAKGAKMPRGDKEEIMKYPMFLPPLNIQRKIVSILSKIDRKIQINLNINNILEQMSMTLYKDLFYSGGIKCKIDELLLINPTITIKKNTELKFIDMKALPTDSCSVQYGDIQKKSYTSGTKFSNGDILFARITPCLQNGKTAIVDFLEEGEIGAGSTEFLILRPTDLSCSQYIYCLSRDKRFRKHAEQSMVGTSGRQRVQNQSILDFEVTLPAPEVMKYFNEVTKNWFNLINKNTLANYNLKEIRDYLLPRLISGEVDISEAAKKVREVISSEQPESSV